MSELFSRDAEALPRLPSRGPDSHKGDFGRALLIGGSRGMAGAIALSGMATLRSGAGLVRLAVPAACQDAVSTFEPSYMTVGLPADAEGRLNAEARDAIAALVKDATVVACGPGLGHSDDLTELVGWLYATLPQPLVLDADALNALASRPELLERAAGPRILTPHPGEFGRLLGLNAREVKTHRESLATQLAARLGVVLVVKGNRTYVTDGHEGAINGTGNPGMATGGTGDVLTGVITALLCQGMKPYQAARLGVHVHGLAGDMAAEDLGQVSLIASDVVQYLPDAFRAMEEEEDEG